MFAYDDNKQAYIKDIDAGSYRDLVEAAEICQVAIIHPGMPRNPAEPGLDELIERAEPFRWSFSHAGLGDEEVNIVISVFKELKSR